MKKLILLSFLLFFFCGYSQNKYQQFKNLSAPKKWWVIWHPFKAKRALKISKEANKITDSVQKTSLLKGGRSGGQIDAFRHAYWMARLHQEIGKNAARSLGKAHEKENYLTFKKMQLEDGAIPDEISSKMDLFNNNIGISLTYKGEKVSQKTLIYRIVNAIQQGKMRIIKKDKKGNFLSPDGKIIDKKTLKGKWKNNKCLVNSNKNLK